MAYNLQKYNFKETWTEKALSTPELLSLIMTNADKDTQARSARVSSYWFDTAIPILWFSIQKLECLLNLFPRGGWAGEYKTDADSDWIRFNVYAGHVRTISISNEDISRYSSSLNQIAYLNHVPCLLRNLQELISEPQHNTYYLLLFLNKSLKHFTYNPILPAYCDLPVICGHIIPAIPNLTHLSLHLHDHQYNEEALEFAVESLKSLQYLEINYINLTSALLGSIALHPKLISFDYASGPLIRGWAGERNVDANKGHQGDGRNTSELKNISFNFREEALNRFICLDMSYPALVDLRITILESEDAMGRALLNCCKMISLKMTSLSYLNLDLEFLLKSDSRDEELNLECLGVLADLRDMRQFVLTHEAPVMITNAIIEDLIRNWSNLISFEIYSNSTSAFKPKATLQVLQSFSTYCKNLECLSIPIDGTETCQIPPHVVPMKNLNRLDFGYSPIADINVGPVSLYLCRFCTTSCPLVISDATPLEDDDLVLKGYRDIWIVLAVALHFMLNAVEQSQNSVQAAVDAN